jgi:drug/metabolite transporter (DMT)-like permease
MTTSYLFMVIGLLSFAAMGVVHKIGDRCQARPLPIALYALVTAGLLSALRVWWTHSLSAGSAPPRILLVAILSIVFYHEPVGWKKALVLVLVVVSLLLLWWDRRARDGQTDPAISVATEVI